MTKASDNAFPSILLVEQGSTPASPSAGQQRLFLKSADHLPYLVNSGGSVAAVGGAGGSTAFCGCRLYASNTQSIGNSSWTAVTFDTEEADTDAFHSTVSNTSRITIPTGKDGYYAGVAIITWDTNTTNNRYVWWRKNGSDMRGSLAWGVASSSRSTIVCPIPALSLVATDYLEVGVFQDSGGSRTIGDASSAIYQSSVGVWRVGT